MSKKRVYFYLFILPLLVAIIFLASKQTSRANTTGTNVVISQIQIAKLGSGNADQEFVELYNPTNSGIDLSGWRLTRKSSGGSQTTLVSNIAGTIAAHGYFLIAHPSYSNPALTPDLTYSASTSAIANNNSVVLYSDAGQTVVDKVGFGSTPVTDFETGQFGENPEPDQSIIRKASQNSTPTTLSTGGAEVNQGNSFDTDNNANDFVLLETANPRNSSSPIATIPTTTSSLTPTGTLPPTMTPTNTPTITIIPTTIPTTLTPSPTIHPTAAPTSTPTKTPTPTQTDTPTPSQIPSPTSQTSPTISPTLTPSTTPPHDHRPRHEKEEHHHHFHVEFKQHKVNFFGKHFSLPYIHCSFRRN